MIHWQDEPDEATYQVPLDTLDLVFRITCDALPVDHAAVLCEAIRSRLPWFGGVPEDGLHLIHGASSGNGWERPSDAAGLIYLSRRTPLSLRLTSDRIAAGQALSGADLQIAGRILRVSEGKTKPLARTDTLYSRHVIDLHHDEEAFLEGAVAAMRDLGVQFRKVLAGKAAILTGPDGPVRARSLLVAGLPFPDAWLLQSRGIGPGRAFGCGLFVAHKPV